MWLIGAMVCLLAAPWVQLSVSAGSGWPHVALRHNWLMPISCHFRDCKALLVTSLTHVSGAMTRVQTFTFTFTDFVPALYWHYGCLRFAGNENIHLLTSNARQKLRVDLADFEGINAFAEYDDFNVGNETEQYKLVSIGKYNGTAGQCGVKTSTELCSRVENIWSHESKLERQAMAWRLCWNGRLWHEGCAGTAGYGMRVMLERQAMAWGLSFLLCLFVRYQLTKLIEITEKLRWHFQKRSTMLLESRR